MVLVLKSEVEATVTIDMRHIPPSTGGETAVSASRPLEVVAVDGSGSAAGRIYGEECRTLVREHLAAVVDHAGQRRGLTEDTLLERSLPYRGVVQAAFPRLAAEIDGIAVGAGIPRAAAWLLQLRAEVLHEDGPVHAPECTIFGATGTATASGRTLAGQNGDLPAFYQDVLVMVRRTQPDRPRVLTLTPAGQVAWHGMNELGVAVFASFLYSDGWRVGIPRYLFTRIALEERTARDAVRRLSDLRRASPRNVLVADEHDVIDVELDVERAGVLETDDGLLAHANHHLSPLAAEERGSEQLLANSRARQARMEQLLRDHHGRLDPASAAAILRDREGVPDALCIDPADDPPSGESTVASSIADVAGRELWSAVGPPHKSSYHCYPV